MSFKISVQQLLHEPPAPARPIEAKKSAFKTMCPTCKDRPKVVSANGVRQPYCLDCAAEHNRTNRARAKARREKANEERIFDNGCTNPND